MARVQVGYDPSPEGLQTTAAPNVLTERVRMDPRENSGFRLAEALGKAQPILDDWKQDYERKRLEEQLMKVSAYKDTFRNNYSGGAVSAAQVKQVFPEAVPVVAARVAESVGVDEGKKFAQGLINEINADATLRLDTTKRMAFVDQKKKEWLANNGQAGNEFFNSGWSKSFDAEVNAWDNSWMRETANYHEQVQSTNFSDEVGRAIDSGNLAEVENLDTRWGASSSLNNVQRKKLVVDTFIKKAFTSDNPDLLKTIPQRFLNEDLKKEVLTAENQITQIRMQKLRDAQFLETRAREENVRNAKTRIINDVAQGKQIDPAMYRGDNESFQFALAMKDTGLVPEPRSIAAATMVRTAILNGSTVSSMNQSQVIDQILTNPSINPKEKSALIAEIPKLLEGMVLLNDSSVQAQVNVRLDPRLKALESSTNATIQTLIAGRNLRAEAMKVFQADLQNSFQAFYEDNKGQWPTGRAKQDIIDRAVEKAERVISEMTRIDTKGAAGGQPQPAATAPRATANPNAPAQNPAPQVGAVVNGYKFKGGNPADQKNWEKVK